MTPVILLVAVLFGPPFGFLLALSDFFFRLLGGTGGPDWTRSIPYFALHSLPLIFLASMPSVPACYAAVGQETGLDIPLVTVITGILIALGAGFIGYGIKRQDRQEKQISDHETKLAVHAKELERLTRIETKLDQLTTLVRNGH